MGWAAEKKLRLTITVGDFNALPSGDILHLGLTEGAALRQLSDTGHSSGTIGARLGHDIGQDFMEELDNVAVHLLELKQERVVAFGAIDALEARIGDASGNLLLLRKGEQTIRLDAKNQSRLLYASEGLEDGIVSVGAGIAAAAGHVVRIELAGHGDVAVGIESLDEFITLVTKI